LTKKINDPNAVSVYKPWGIEMKQIEVDGELHEIIDDSKLLNPIEVIFPSSQVLGFEDGVYCLVLLDEKSIVTVGGKKERTGMIMDLYDTEDIYKIIQVGSKKDFIFEIRCS
jgi:hypothetical protein